MTRFRTVGVQMKVPLCEAFVFDRDRDGWTIYECDADARESRDGHHCCATHKNASSVQWTDLKTSGAYYEDLARTCAEAHAA
jgi:hypothetical protein